jgi:hypothetical protein
MKPWLLCLALGSLLVAADSASAQGKKKAGRRSGWLTDYESAKVLARKTGKPLMVVFRCEP